MLNNFSLVFDIDGVIIKNKPLLKKVNNNCNNFIKKYKNFKSIHSAKILNEYLYKNKGHSLRGIYNDINFNHDKIIISNMFNKNVYDREKVGEYLTYTFWEKACEIAISFGYSGCHSYGRTGGWAIPYFTKNTKCEYIKATSDKSISNDISLENFKAFASYIEKLWRLIDIEAKTIETEDQLTKLQSRIEEL